ncbi:MAG TPA: discoidin domain-containing protein [Pyrinomonadaceae bacterium]|nr:discoidin domain-containing protein [Pyrinomonadaceae bacterium]
MVAEYPVDGAFNSPGKEYGYRIGQLLVTAEPLTASPVNVASAANGATATASSSFSGFAASGAINGDRRGLFAWQNGYWSTAAPGFPSWLEVQFNGLKTITEIDVITPQDNYQAPIEPTEATTFTVSGPTSYEVQYWSGSAWVTIPNGTVTGNNKVWKKFTFAAISTTKIRVLTSASADNYTRLVEVEAWTGPSPAPRYNLASASMGAVATASNSASSGYGPAGANNGDRKSLNWTNGGGWNDSGPPFPDWLQIDFGSAKTINEVGVFTLQDNWANSAEPTESMIFTQWGLTGYEVQYWTGSAWITIPGASVTGNNKIWRKFTFSPISTSKIRVLTNASVDGYSRITEVEAYGPVDTGASGGVHWLVSDHLGTPRMKFDQTGALENVKRHDYLPFGEDLSSQQGKRDSTLGYTGDDGVRQQFTSKERDVETGLDYFLARYYSSTQGRFTSPDEFSGGPDQVYALGKGDAEKQALPYADITQPQSLNKYQYTYNSPLNYVDADGHCPVCVVVVIIAIATSAEYANAPTLNPNEPRYSSGTGQAELVSNIMYGELGGGLFNRVASPIMQRLFPRLFAQEAVDQAVGQAVGQAEARIVANAAQGAKFEKHVIGILNQPKNTARIMQGGEATGAAYRIPDLLPKKIGEVLGEIKSNQSTLQLTNQFRDLLTYATKTNNTLKLYVTPETKIAPKLADALKEAGAEVYDVAGNTISKRKL